ncbi:tubulin alpha-4 chain-like isoform X2 [Pseudomyrmex gracilis]|nr:tubulin alpha-4 chain-like isoform X2 [Pseudomyrmex gracilis]
MVYPHDDISIMTGHDVTWQPTLYHPDSIIGLRNNFNEAFFPQGYFLDQEGLERTLNRIRIMCEQCSNLDGFIICRQYSEHINGFISRLLENFTEDYKKKTKIDYAKVPPPSSINCHTRTAVLNTFFTLSDCMKNIDCCIIADNSALRKIYTEKLHQNVGENYYYIYSVYNRVLAQAFSTITSPLRFRSTNNWSLDNYKVLVPHKQIPFVAMSYAPFVTIERLELHNQLIADVTNECLDPANQTLSYNPRNGAYISSLLVYRGSEVIQTDVTTMVANINDQCKQGVDMRRANGIENPFQGTSVRTGTAAVESTYIACPIQSVASCSNNTDLYYYWKALAVNAEDALYDKTRHSEEQLNTLDQIKSCYNYINSTMNRNYDYKVELKNVNECLLNMLDLYADYDCKIQHDRRFSGFVHHGFS